MKKIRIIFTLQLIALLTSAQDHNESLKNLLEFVDQTKEYKEGFSSSTGQNDFKYHSIRTDINDCLLTRATDGTMSIEWTTSPAGTQMQDKGTGFLWIAAMDMTSSKCAFDMYFNDIKRFTIHSGTDTHWSLKSDDGGSLRFFTKEQDHHGDAHGYMALWAPGSWIKPGQPQKIKITGNASGSNAWIIVYKAADAAEYLQNAVQYDKWIRLYARKEGNNYSIKVTAPKYFAGETLTYSSNKNTGTFKTKSEEDHAAGEFQISRQALGSPFVLKDAYSEIIAVDVFGKEASASKLLSNAILKNDQEVDDKGSILINAQRIYSPKTVISLNELAQSNLTDGKIYLMNSSHQDIAWMDSPEKCVLERDTMLLTPLFELAAKNPDYRFDIEDALMIREYVYRHPDKREMIREMLSDGRISCGSTFIQPYEEMYSGESLARQFYFGAKWLKDEFDYHANVYWNVDVPGRTLQMPQIMKKAGTDYLMMSRFEKGFYHWYSPDGSYITAFSPGHYADAFRPLQMNFYDAAQYIGSSSLYWEKYYPDKSSGAPIPLLSDWDMSPAVDYTPFIDKWESINELQNEEGNFTPVALPAFQIASGPEFFQALSTSARDLPAIKGERPAIWLYIHGPSHQKALKASREGDILLTQAEKFATANAWIDGSFKNYPQKDLNEAWEAKIYPDHGWGGKNGEITDNLFYQKYLFARDRGKTILDNNLREISSKINTRTENGTPLVIFNSLNWSRTDVATARLNFDEGEAFYISLKDAEGHEIPLQIKSKELFPDGSLRSAEICFIAENIPSIGYKTYYFTPVSEPPSQSPEDGERLENKFYKIELSDGGLKSIYDKELEIELIDPSKFKAGEVFTMRSIGNGAGEFAAVQQPDMEGFDKTSYYPATWELKNEGPVYTSYKMRQPIRNAVVEQEVILYHDIKKIDFQVDILSWEGILYREYRFAMPLNMPEGRVVYEVPYGVVEVGKDEMEGAAGERYVVPCKETRPRAIQNWIGSYDGNHCVILSSSVVAADYLYPGDGQDTNPLLQPILFASRKSCHGEGNDYLQTGDHSFHFSLTSAPSHWRNGYRSALQSNEKFLAIVAPIPYQNTVLPEENSFFDLNAQNVMITTIKKAENESNTVFRLVEIEGLDTQVSVNSFKDDVEIYRANLIEEPLQNLGSIKNEILKIGHHAIETFLMK
jgi:alpha-mannosidase